MEVRPQPVPRCNGTGSKVSRRCWSPQYPYSGRSRSPVPPYNATLRGHEEQSCGSRGGRKPLLDFRIAGVKWAAWTGGVELLENMGREFSQVRVTSSGGDLR